MKDGVHPQTKEMTDVEYEKWFKEQWEEVVEMLKGHDLSKIHIVAYS